MCHIPMCPWDSGLSFTPREKMRCEVFFFFQFCIIFTLQLSVMPSHGLNPDPFFPKA